MHREPHIITACLAKMSSWKIQRRFQYRLLQIPRIADAAGDFHLLENVFLAVHCGEALQISSMPESLLS
jgi:hypothetical protein